jgi:hypothetical protein
MTLKYIPTWNIFFTTEQVYGAQTHKYDARFSHATKHTENEGEIKVNGQKVIRCKMARTTGQSDKHTREATVGNIESISEEGRRTDRWIILGNH